MMVTVTDPLGVTGPMTLGVLSRCPLHESMPGASGHHSPRYHSDHPPAHRPTCLNRIVSIPELTIAFMPKP